MADKKPILSDVQSQFEEEMYKLGLELVESFRKGTCSDKGKVLDAAIKILDISKRG